MINYETDRTFTVAALREWLETQPPEREFLIDGGITGTSVRRQAVRDAHWHPLPTMPCPIAVWVKETTLARQVDAACYIALDMADRWHYYEIPAGLSEAMGRFEDSGDADGVITAQQALEALHD